MIRTSLSLWVLIAALPVWGSPQAQDNDPTTSLVVLPVGLDERAQAEIGRVNYAAELAASRYLHGDLKHLDDALDPEGAQRRAAVLAEGEISFQLGQKAYEDLDARGALRAFDRATQSFGQSNLVERAFARFTEAWAMKIAALIASGDHRQGQAEIDKLLVAAPAIHFSANFFPPDDIAYGEKVRVRLAGEKMPLTVSSSIPSSVVYLDGRYVGKVPVELSVINGEHFLTVETPGYRNCETRVPPGRFSCNPDPASGLSQLQTALAMLTNKFGISDRKVVAANFGRSVGADQVLLLLAKSEANNLITLTTGRLSATNSYRWTEVTKTFNLASNLEERVKVWIEELLGRDQAPRQGPRRQNSTRTDAGYILLGTAVALVAGGVLFGIQARNDSSTFQSLPQTDPNVTAIRSSSRIYGIAADIFLVGALAAGVGGTYLSFFPPPTAAPSIQ